MTTDETEWKPCECGQPLPIPTFDEEASRGLSSEEVRRRWPRVTYQCVCGRSGIRYASFTHYLAGDY